MLSFACVLTTFDGRSNGVRPPDCVVLRFTYWYTARPPVHEAVVRRQA